MATPRLNTRGDSVREGWHFSTSVTQKLISRSRFKLPRPKDKPISMRGYVSGRINSHCHSLPLCDPRSILWPFCGRSQNVPESWNKGLCANLDILRHFLESFLSSRVSRAAKKKLNMPLEALCTSTHAGSLYAVRKAKNSSTTRPVQVLVLARTFRISLLKFLTARLYTFFVFMMR
jgi:hypothetical protein